MQIPDVIRSELRAGEQVLWSGRPRQGLLLRGSDVFMIPFSLVWAGIVFKTMGGGVGSESSFEFLLPIVPFVLIAVYFVVGRFFVDAKLRAKTFYAVTPQRLIITTGLFSQKIQSLNLRTISDLSMSKRSDGSGTITFGPQSPFAAMAGGMGSLPGFGPQAGPQFDLIPNVRDVYDVLVKAQEAVR